VIERGRISPLSSCPVFESGAVAQTEQIVGLHRRAVLHSKPVGATEAYPEREASWSAARQRCFGQEHRKISAKVRCASGKKRLSFRFDNEKIGHTFALDTDSTGILQT
jgi:hypothetical protein